MKTQLYEAFELVITAGCATAVTVMLAVGLVSGILPATSTANAQVAAAPAETTLQVARLEPIQVTGIRVAQSN